MQKELISIVIPTYNEEGNIRELYKQLLFQFKNQVCKNYDFEIIFIDNNSTDKTQNIIREICSEYKNVKAIFNIKNFGHTKSPFYGLQQSSGNASILISADLQDPIELIPRLVEKWENGEKIVLFQRKKQKDFFLEKLKLLYYKFLNMVSESYLPERVTGSGIFDKSVISELKKIEDPNPYFRGLVVELFGEIQTIEFVQPKRKSGISKNNLYTLYDLGILAIVKHSKKLLRFATAAGFVISLVSFLIGIFFLFYKLFFWNSFELGIAPIILILTFGISAQVLIIGILGEYINVILDHSRKLPLVVEKERINF